MAKNFLAFLGLVFLTILIVVGVALIAYLFNIFQIISLPSDLLVWIKPETKLFVEATPFDKVDWIIPTRSDSPSTPTPFPTDTPVPELALESISPLEPGIYKAQTGERLKRFVSALENWRDLNNELVKESNLARDAAWRDEMEISLEVVILTGMGLAEVGPPPAEFVDIDAWLNQIPAETEGLKNSYIEALETGNRQSFLVAGDHFARIKEILAGTVQEMITRGWPIE